MSAAQHIALFFAIMLEKMVQPKALAQWQAYVNYGEDAVENLDFMNTSAYLICSNRVKFSTKCHSHSFFH